MQTDLPAPLLLLLHEGGWDEMIMVGVGLLIAYLVIVWTGRRSKDDEDEDWEDEDVSDGVKGGSDSGSSGPRADDTEISRP